MDWKDIASAVGGFAPLIGTLLGGPAGGAVGGMVAAALGVDNKPDAVSQAIAVNPDAAVKLRAIEAEQRVKLQELLVTAEQNRLVAETASVAAVNATMQAEAKSDHWPTYTWRPFIGFAFGCLALIGGVTAAGAYIGVMFLHVDTAVLIQLPGLLAAEAAVMGTMAPILGIASWFRGRMQADPSVPTDNRG
jgi:hypothetical protein